LATCVVGSYTCAPRANSDRDCGPSSDCEVTRFSVASSATTTAKISVAAAAAARHYKVVNQYVSNKRRPISCVDLLL
jgi:hypothetical protein